MGKEIKKERQNKGIGDRYIKFLSIKSLISASSGGWGLLPSQQLPSHQHFKHSASPANSQKLSSTLDRWHLRTYPSTPSPTPQLSIISELTQPSPINTAQYQLSRHNTALLSSAPKTPPPQQSHSPSKTSSPSSPTQPPSRTLVSLPLRFLDSLPLVR